MTLAPVESLLRTRIGLDPASLGPTALSKAVEQRMRAQHVVTLAAYAGLLAADPVEWAALVAGLSVKETWFFRGGRALFDFLATWVRERPAPARVLVVPCSTGEEAYSLALALADKGEGEVRIDAVDLLADNIARAGLGRYPTFSFREPSSDPRARYFHPHGESWELRPECRDRVRFRTGNAVSPVFLADESPYDLILCRNLFIYLTPAARRQVTANLDRLLSPTGRLCLTASEADQLPADRFQPDGPTAFGVYKRATRQECTPRAPRVEPASQTVWEPAPVPLAERAESTPIPPDSLAAARALADAGDLDAALTLCAGLRPSAEAFALAGVIHVAANRPDRAAELFRKALYLDPHHPDALAHAAALCDHRGDSAQAELHRRHLARLKPGDAG